MHTTRSWEFAGLKEATTWKNLEKEDLLIKSRYGKDVIVGMLDNGMCVCIFSWFAIKVQIPLLIVIYVARDSVLNCTFVLLPLALAYTF